MSQTIPATAVLGPGKTGLTIGLTVLNIDGTEYAAFSATGFDSDVHLSPINGPAAGVLA